MGFYLRKSISVGPLRFNLSKSGIGVSAGVKGLRFGVGPKGNYVHMGRGGLYYRATIPFSPSSPSPASSRPLPPDRPYHAIPSESHGPLKEIESADVSRLVDSSSRDLLDELNRKRNKMRLWPLAASVTALVVFVSINVGWPGWLILALLVAGLAGTYVARSHDALAKTTVLFYDFDAEMEEAYGRLHSAAEKMADCSSAWHVDAQGKVHDRKYHAGASTLLRRKNTFIGKAEPPYVKSNIETIAIGVGRQTLHFFPDRVLVYSSNGVGAVGYQELSVSVKATRFIEDGSPPRDAKVVDRTWQYVNKSGGPDRRFKANRELPVCLYDEISLTSRTGLNELLQISKCDVADAFAKAISSLARKIPGERSGLAPTA